MSKMIDGEKLLRKLGMAEKCEDCPNRTHKLFCGLGSELMEVCDTITEMMEEEPEVKKPDLTKEVPEEVLKAANDLGEYIDKFIEAVMAFVEG